MSITLIEQTAKRIIGILPGTIRETEKRKNSDVTNILS